jgi:predicted enzyme related to lactoylglutathione lyase
MSSGIQTLVIPTTDPDAAKALLSVLAGQPHTDEAYYVGWNVNGFEIGLNPNGHAGGMTGPINYWQTDDITKTVAELIDAGATAGQAPTEVGGGTTIATVSDGDGNVIGLIQRV